MIFIHCKTKNSKYIYILLNNTKFISIRSIQKYTIVFQVNPVQKLILPAGTAFSANNFTNATMHIHSRHPYLLGFDNNLVPNLNILVFQLYPGEDSEYSEQSGRFA